MLTSASQPRLLALSLALAVVLAASLRAHAEGDLPGAEVAGYPACVRAIEASPVKPSFTTSEPGAGAGKRILAALAKVRSSLRETRYQHATRVQARRGVYLWDCSGMAADADR